MALMVFMYGVMLAGAMVYTAAPSLWFLFRWHVLGWKPEILNEELVSRTVAKCVPSAMAELGGPAVSDEQKRQQLERLFREVILRYAKNFSVHLSEGQQADKASDES